MLLFLFFDFQFVTITFFIIYCENNLGTFSYYHLMVVNDSKIVQKVPKNSFVRAVTILHHVKVNIVDIY